MVRSLTSDAYRAFIQELVSARKASGLSQVDLAARLDLPQSYVSKVERCERRLDVVEFVAFARAMGLEPGRLIEDILGASEDR
jgi:transcriptional regulator with XRE-family HTH domain